ncbi:MBL fold metallo-hydrolase [Candidatus Micrarchaeota archaeon]|nr:MBL fold metallo-hydrolase [Candidatus Micrarchaeota archaeon]
MQRIDEVPALRLPSQVLRLRQHPLIDRITDHTYAVKGGWARTFVFLPDPRDKRCIIIDPGVSNSIEAAYRGSITRRLALLNDMLRGNGEIEALQERAKRLEFLRRLRTDLELVDWKAADDRELFLERAAQLASVVEETGLTVDLIIATHHHIDHLGIGAALRDRLGVQEKVLIPDPGIFNRDKRRGDYQIENTPEMYAQLDRRSESMGFSVIDISGHTTMVGFLLLDGTLIVGDLIGTENMWKRTVMYMEDAERHLRSLLTALGTDFRRIVLSHGKDYNLNVVKSRALLKVNIDRVFAARRAAMRNDPIEAAEEYLGIDGKVGIADIGYTLLTAQHIGAYH